MRIVFLALSVILAVALMGFGPSPQAADPTLADAPPGRASGRAAIGFVGADPNTGESGSAVMGAVMNGAIGRVVIVLTENGAVSFIVDENTRITSPSGTARVLERIAEGLPVRIAVVADRNLVDGDGTPIAESAIARQLTIIPVKATREHRRVIVAEKGTAAKATALDENGDSIDLVVDGAEDGGGISLSADDIPEQGESAVVLVRRNENPGGKAHIRAVVKIQKVIDRLSGLAGNSKLQDDDPFKSAQLEEVLERHQNAVKELLESIRDRTEDRFKEVVNRAADQAKTNAEQRKKARGVISGLSEDSAECAERILGRAPVTKKGIPPGQLQRIEVQCFRQQEDGPDLKIISPEPRAEVNEGDTLLVQIETEDGDGAVTLEIQINGEPVTPDTLTATSASLGYTVPAGTDLVTILATATDQDGNTSVDDRVVNVLRDPPPRVEIRTPAPGEALVAGSTYRVTTYSEDNGEVVSVDLFVNGEQFATEVFEPEETETGSSDRDRSPGGDEQSYAPVHNGAIVPIPSDVASVTIRAVATDNLGNIGTTTMEYRVGSDPVPTVSITSPKEGTEVRAGESITVEVEADDNGEVVSVTGTVADPAGRTALSFESLPGMDWRSSPFTVPDGQDSLTIAVEATDDRGNTATATATFRIAADAAPTVSITSPNAGAEVAAGESITVVVKADDNGEVLSVTGSVTESRVSTALVFEEFPQMDWRSNSYVVPGSATSFGDFTSTVPPHVFTGTVTLNGATAADGTVVTATIEGSGDGGTLAIAVTATDDRGATATATREVKIKPSRVEIVRGVVSGGTFILLVEQPPSESFGGREIRFTVGGQEAAQAPTWELGGVSELNLSAP